MGLEEQANIMGGLQRQRSNQELAELNRRLREMKAREDAEREAERAAPKCPYCAGTIAKDVSKCRHCASDIEWFEFEGLIGPCKTGQSAEIIQEKIEELRINLLAQKTLEARIQKEAKEIESILRQYPKCPKCFKIHSTDNYDVAGRLRLRRGLCNLCTIKRNQSMNSDGSVTGFIVVISILLAIYWFLNR
jgi:ribosomal protein L37AE/L43A